MLKVASPALVLIQYTLYNNDWSSTSLSISFWKGSGTSWLQVKKKENKVNGTLLLLLLVKQNYSNQKKKRENIVKY